MNALIKKIIAAVISAMLSVFVCAACNAQTLPVQNEGKKWRIAYYEGGPYNEYQKYFIATIRGLMALNWVETADIPPQRGEQTKDLWDWLRANAESDYIEFVEDGHYSAGWDEALRAGLAATIINRLNQQKDIDLIIAMGTWAGQDLANNKHSIPTLVLSTTDPIGAGIIKSAEDSGFGHVHARIGPERYRRQIRLFHDAIGFQKLGVAYNESETGRSYAAMDDVETVARERSFDVVSCHTKTDIRDTKEAEQSVIECFRKLATQTDAIYVTTQQGVSLESLPQLVQIAARAKIPTFSQVGVDEVKSGILLSMAQSYKETGEFHARNIVKVFHGARPGDIGQIFEDPPKLAINLKTAEIIGYDPPLIVLGAADQIFHETPARK